MQMMTSLFVVITQRVVVISYRRFGTTYRSHRRPGLRSRYSDSLRAGRSGDRIPVGARFSAPVQNGPGVHPASCTMGTGSFQGVKRPGRGADHPPPPKRRGHERGELYLYSPSGPSWPALGRTLKNTAGFVFVQITCKTHWHMFIALLFLAVQSLVDVSLFPVLEASQNNIF